MAIIHDSHTKCKQTVLGTPRNINKNDLAFKVLRKLKECGEIINSETQSITSCLSTNISNNGTE